MNNLHIRFHILFIAIVILISPIVYSQDFSAVDKKVDSYPKAYQHFDILASQINGDFSNDADKARAAFVWIAKNVQYDLALSRSNVQPKSFTFKTQDERIRKERQIDMDLALKTLRTKKGVCHGYTVLYNELMSKLGIESVLIPGTSKSNPMQIGLQPKYADHAWNAIKLNGKWQFVDVTWGAGAIDGRSGRFVFKYSPAYFLTPPESFFLNHFPEDPKWLMVDKSADDFANLPLYYGDFLKHDFEILTPSTGILSNVSVLKFKLANLKSQNVAFAWSTDMVVKPVNLSQAGDITTFDIEVAKNANAFLTIFIDNMSVVTYKIAGGAS